MNAPLALTVACLVAVAFAADAQDADIDLEAFFQSPERIKAFVSCLLDESTCANDRVKAMRGWLGDSYNNKSSQLTDKQKELVRKAVKISMEKLPQEWAKIEKTFDPDGSRKENFTKFIKGE